MRLSPSSCLLLSLLLASSGGAQEQRISTDNPSIATTASTVGAGVVQWEGSFDYSSGKTAPRATRRRFADDEEGEASEPDLYSLPQLFRIGLSDDFELRVDTGGLSFQGKRYGLDDMAVGAKWKFYDQDGLTMGLLAEVLIPSGSSAFRSPKPLPFAVFAADYALDETNTISLNLGAGLGIQGTTLYGQGVTTLDYSHDFGDVSTYVELAVDGPGTLGGSLETTVDAGLSFYMTDDFVVNLAVFRGLSATGIDWGASVGFGARL